MEYVSGSVDKFNLGTAGGEGLFYETLDEDVEYLHDEVFFFGKIADTENIFGQGGSDVFDENSYYAFCAGEEKLFKLKKKPKNGDDFTCPSCGTFGTLYDFRDRNVPLEHYGTLQYSFIEQYDNGFVLRIFDCGLDYSSRDYDDMGSLSYYPEAEVIEVAREYWWDGKIEYYEDVNALEDDKPNWRAVDTICDDGGCVYNYNNEYNPMSESTYINDITNDLNQPNATFIQASCGKLSYNTYRTLMKYGFRQLAAASIYGVIGTIDSVKISEILGVDYNQIIAVFDEETFSIYEWQACKTLKEKNIRITVDNVAIVEAINNRVFDYEVGDVKLFKYLRNLMHKHNNPNIVRDYCDYIDDCKLLNYDLTSNDIRFPSKFTEKHEEFHKRRVIVATSAKENKYAVVYEKYSEYSGFTDGKMTILLAPTAYSIIEEGRMQKNCVGSYVEGVLREDCLIFFIRRNDEIDKSFFTLEYTLSGRRVSQCRGYRNENQGGAVENAVETFYKNWIASMKNKLTRKAPNDKVA